MAAETMASINKSLVKSDIQRFYSGKTIFVTGATGFVGKALVEKLLRSCSDVKRIYLLVRDKKGNLADKRMKDLFDDPLFDPLKQTSTDLYSKIHLIQGDLELEEMALSEEDKNIIIDEVNIIFHAASITKLNERFSKALKMNVMGTRAMLDLAKQCKHIEGFLYVSTAYCHGYQSDIMEEAYSSPIDMKYVQNIIDKDLAEPTGLSEKAVKNIINKYPNTYCFTKAIAESLIDDASKQVPHPCIIYRPSAVMPTWKEPFRGWCGNQYGFTLLALIYALGIIHTALMKNIIADLIPVDMVVNSILVSFWNSVQEKRSKTSGAHIYNYATSVENPIRILRFRDLCLQRGEKIANPSIHMMWTNFCIFTESRLYFTVLHIMFHVIPALMIDAYRLVIGKNRKGFPLLKKVTSSVTALIHFIRTEFRIDISQMMKAVDRMNSIDQELFFCDVRKLDWQDYCSTYWDGIRLYVLKDPVSTIPEARRKLCKIETVHYFIKYAGLLLIAYAITRYLNLL